VRHSLPLVALELAVLAAGAPQKAAAAQSCPKESGVFIAYGGADRYKLGEARRIPPGELVSLHGKPRPLRLPIVTIRRADAASSESVPVALDDQGCGWVASLPSTSANAKSEIRVIQYESPSQTELRLIDSTFRLMLGQFIQGLATGEVRTRATPAEFTQSGRDYLKRYFNPDSILTGYVLFRADQPVSGALGGQLIDLITSSSDFGIPDAFRSYREALQQLREVLTNTATIATLSLDRRVLVEGLLDRLGRQDFFADARTADRRVAEILNEPAGVIPISALRAEALSDLVGRVYSGTDGNTGQLRDAALARVQLLATPLASLLPDLYAAMFAVRDQAYELTTINGPMWMGDLQRFGTIDFVTGQVFGNAVDGASSRNRGFLTLSFFPGGPQSRTPGDVSEEEGRMALMLGYSVTGSSAADTTEYLVGGVTLRTNRYFSINAGLVSPQSGGKFRCCFVGLAGDLTALPFLNDLFVSKPSGSR
jgi:hypothetical protein